MLTTALEVVRGQVEGLQLCKIMGAEVGEFFEKLGQGLALGCVLVGGAVEWAEGLRLALGENDFGAREPVGALAVVDVGEDVTGRPSAFAFVRLSHGFREVMQERAEGGGGVGEESDGLLEVVFHGRGSSLCNR